MKSIDIKGRKYVEVNERIKYFRENFKEWALESEIVSLENGVCVIKATVRNPEGVIKATGYAYETENSSFINKTSFIENCETSAWGRALGNLGIGIDASIASAEEVLNAQLNQDQLNQKKKKTEQKPEENETVKELFETSIEEQLLIDEVKLIFDLKEFEKFFKAKKPIAEKNDFKEFLKTAKTQYNVILANKKQKEGQ